MIAVYAVSLLVGVVLLVAWIFLRVYAANTGRASIDPERRLGQAGRRLVAALVGFGMAGMSAEFSSREIAWPVALLLALAGAGGAAWYAGSRLEDETREEA